VLLDRGERDQFVVKTKLEGYEKNNIEDEGEELIQMTS